MLVLRFLVFVLHKKILKSQLVRMKRLLKLTFWLPGKKYFPFAIFFKFHNLCKVHRILGSGKQIQSFYFWFTVYITVHISTSYKVKLNLNQLVPKKIPKSQNENEFNIPRFVHASSLLFHLVWFCFGVFIWYKTSKINSQLDLRNPVATKELPQKLAVTLKLKTRVGDWQVRKVENCTHCPFWEEETILKKKHVKNRWVFLWEQTLLN